MCVYRNAYSLPLGLVVYGITVSQHNQGHLGRSLNYLGSYQGL